MKPSLSLICSGLLLVGLSIGLTACQGPFPEMRLPEFGKAKTEAKQEIALPKVVAIMPFANETEQENAADRVRKSVYNTFASAPYVDVELSTVDRGIARLETRTGMSASDMDRQAVCQEIGCNGLLFGKVLDYQKSFGGVFSRLSAEVELWLVNVDTGEEVARVRDSVNYLEGGIPLSPLGAIMSALSSAANIRDIQETRMVGELAGKLIAGIPVPEAGPAVRRPAIEEMITNVAEGPFGSGSVIRVGLQGEPGAVAMFDIGNFKKGLPMTERQPGVYLGEYAVLPGDRTRDMPITGYLKRPSGPESRWIDVSGLVAVDTSAPGKVFGVRATGHRDRIAVSWDSLGDDVSDLAGYRVLRSESPLSGYREVALAEVTAYEDRAVREGVVYYYRVEAVDRSGNASDVSATVSAQLATQKASVLSGPLDGDTVLSGLYILRGQVLVPEGIRLTIGPETNIVAEDGSGFLVRGTLAADGTTGLVRVFSRRTGKWAGIAVERGQVRLKGVVVSGAETALRLKETRGAIEDVTVTDNAVGIHISGSPAVVVRNAWVAANETGIALVGTDARILSSTIVRNGIGVSLRRFTGEVSENIIVDNQQNIASDFPMKLEPNYIGQSEPQRRPTAVAAGAVRN